MSGQAPPERSHLPDPADPELAPFWDGCRAGELRIPRCDDCARWVWYPRRRCPGCGARSLSWTAVSGRGRLFTWVTVHRSFLPGFVDRLPFVTALVELEEDPSIRIATFLDAPTDAPLRAGMPVRVGFERIDDRLVLPRFRPDPG